MFFTFLIYFGIIVNSCCHACMEAILIQSVSNPACALYEFQ